MCFVKLFFRSRLAKPRNCPRAGLGGFEGFLFLVVGIFENTHVSIGVRTEIVCMLDFGLILFRYVGIWIILYGGICIILVSVCSSLPHACFPSLEFGSWLFLCMYSSGSVVSY